MSSKQLKNLNYDQIKEELRKDLFQEITEKLNSNKPTESSVWAIFTKTQN